MTTHCAYQTNMLLSEWYMCIAMNNMLLWEWYMYIAMNNMLLWEWYMYIHQYYMLLWEWYMYIRQYYTFFRNGTCTFTSTTHWLENGTCAFTSTTCCFENDPCTSRTMSCYENGSSASTTRACLLWEWYMYIYKDSMGLIETSKVFLVQNDFSMEWSHFMEFAHEQRRLLYMAQWWCHHREGGHSHFHCRDDRWWKVYCWTLINDVERK